MYIHIDTRMNTYVYIYIYIYIFRVPAKVRCSDFARASA